jgi:hypothetical protein
MSAEQAAGTHCVLSESCVGTTTHRVSCDLGVLALSLGSESYREFTGADRWVTGDGPYSHFFLDELLLLAYSSSRILFRPVSIAPASCWRFCFFGIRQSTHINLRRSDLECGSPAAAFLSDSYDSRFRRGSISPLFAIPTSPAQFQCKSQHSSPLESTLA